MTVTTQTSPPPYLLIQEVTSIVVHWRYKPEHDGQLHQGETGGEVQLVQEELREEDEGEEGPVPHQGEGAVAGCLLECLVRGHHQAEQHLQQEVGLSHPHYQPRSGGA